MKVEVRVNPKLTVHADAESVQEVFKQLATAQETFEDTICGLCSSEDLQYVVREAEGNEFYELRCRKCGGKLTFGTSKADKKLYPKRYQTDAKGKAVKDEKGFSIKLGKNKNGWVKYNHNTGKDE